MCRWNGHDAVTNGRRPRNRFARQLRANDCTCRDVADILLRAGVHTPWTERVGRMRGSTTSGMAKARRFLVHLWNKRSHENPDATDRIDTLMSAEVLIQSRGERSLPGRRAR